MRTLFLFLALCSTAFAQVGLRSVGFVAGTIQGSAVSAWYPTNVAGCTIWLKSSQGVYEDLAGTDAVEDADAILNWQNYGALGLSVTNKGNVTNAPTYHASVTFGSATFPAVDFCNDQQVTKGKGLMVKTNWSPSVVFGWNQCTIFAVAQCRTNANTLNSYLFGLAQDATNRVRAYLNMDSTPLSEWGWANSGPTGNTNKAVTCQNTNWMLWEWSHNGATGAWAFTNGVAMLTSVDTDTNRWPVVGEFWLGNLSGINPLEGQIAEFVVYTNFLSGTDLNTVRTYFQTNYNLW